MNLTGKTLYIAARFPIAKIPKIGIQIPVIENAINVINHLLPVIKPSNGGKIRFPAPKNIAKSAKPTTIQSRRPFFIKGLLIY